jgi:hypothetical protein
MLSFTRCIALLLATTLFVVTGSLWAQSDRGTITGTVSDQSGAVMAGVPVTAANTGTGVATKTTSGLGGGCFLYGTPASTNPVTGVVTPYAPVNYIYSSIGNPNVQALPVVQAMPVLCLLPRRYLF